MKKIAIMIYALLFAFTSTLFANEVNIFSARHYDSDVQLYEKFTSKTGIKVNVVSGKDKALQKRIKAEGKAGQSVEMGVIFVMSSNFLSEPGSEWVVGTCFKSPCVAAGNNELTSLFR